MTRSVPEWIGATPNTPAPPRVRLRVWDRDNGRCQCGCGRAILAGESWQTDHRKAIVNGGENRENNLCTLLTEHHKIKTDADVAEKAKVYALRMAHLGFRTTSKRPMPHGKKSNTKRTMDGRVVRR
jgi:5-methylcytosine-specific restriction protein A